MKEIKNLGTVMSINLNTEHQMADVEVDYGAFDIKRLIEAAAPQLPQRKKVQEDLKEFLKLTVRLFGNAPAAVSVKAKLHMNKEFLKERNAYNV